MSEDYKLHTYEGSDLIGDIQRDPGYDFVRNQGERATDTANAISYALLAQQVAKAERKASSARLYATMLHWKKWALIFMFLFGCALTVIVILTGVLVLQP